MHTIDLVIVWDDNALTQETIETAKRYAPDGVQVNSILVPFQGYNKSLNEGAKQGSADIIGFLNNDLHFHENWFEPIRSALETFDSVSPWCPKTHHRWWRSEVPQGRVEGYKVGKIVAGWAIFTTRATWETIGGFDERLEFWCCDNSYSEQLKQHSLKHALVCDAQVSHRLSQTLNTVKGEKYDELTKAQVRLYNRLYDQNIMNLGKA